METEGKDTFDSVARERAFRRPPKNASVAPALNKLAIPHLQSFNALFDDSGLPSGDGDGLGLLSLAIKDIGERVVFDGREGEWGNRLSREYECLAEHFCFMGPKCLSSRYQYPGRCCPPEIGTQQNERCFLLRYELLFRVAHLRLALIGICLKNAPISHLELIICFRRLAND